MTLLLILISSKLTLRVDTKKLYDNKNSSNDNINNNNNNTYYDSYFMEKQKIGEENQKF